MRYATATGRQYNMVVFCNAKAMDSGNLNLKKLQSEFKAASYSYSLKFGPSSPEFSKLFFIEIEYKDSPELFGALQVNSLPMILRISPSTSFSRAGNFALKETDKMDGRRFSWDAEGVASFVKSRTGLRVSNELTARNENEYTFTEKSVQIGIRLRLVCRAKG